MPGVPTTLAAVVACLCGTGSLFAQRERAEPFISGESLSGVGYGEYWESALPAGNDPVVRVDLLEENLYLTTQMGKVHAVDADTGLLRWAQDLGERSFVPRPPSLIAVKSGNGPVVFTTHGTGHVFDRYAGRLIRKVDFPFAAGGGAIADACGMYLGDSKGEFLALNWCVDARCAPLLRWRATVRGAVVAPPVAAFGQLYFASSGGGVYCVGPADKALLWNACVEGTIAGGLHVDESGVYVASTGRRLTILDPRTGRTMARHRMPGPLFDAPMVVQRTVYQYCEGDGLYAFDVDSRREVWRIDEGRAFVARAAENLVLRGIDGGLLFVDNRSGRVKAKAALNDSVMAASNPRDAVLYLVSREGHMVCAKPQGFSYMRRDAMAAARNNLGLSPAAVKATETERLTPSSPVDPATKSGATDDPLRSGTGR